MRNNHDVSSLTTVRPSITIKTNECVVAVVVVVVFLSILSNEENKRCDGSLCVVCGREHVLVNYNSKRAAFEATSSSLTSGKPFTMSTKNLGRRACTTPTYVYDMDRISYVVTKHT